MSQPVRQSAGWSVVVYRTAGQRTSARWSSDSRLRPCDVKWDHTSRPRPRSRPHYRERGWDGDRALRGKCSQIEVKMPKFWPLDESLRSRESNILLRPRAAPWWVSRWRLDGAAACVTSRATPPLGNTSQSLYHCTHLPSSSTQWRWWFTAKMSRLYIGWQWRNFDASWLSPPSSG